MAGYGHAARTHSIGVPNNQDGPSDYLKWCYGRDAGEAVWDCKSAIRRFDSDRRLSVSFESVEI
jgi:hypothetical protein